VHTLIYPQWYLGAKVVSIERYRTEVRARRLTVPGDEALGEGPQTRLSYYVAVPREYAEALHLHAGQKVQVTLEV